MIPKLAKILAGLVIIGLIILAIISVIIPGVFNAFNCALGEVMKGTGDIASCATQLKFSLK